MAYYGSCSKEPHGILWILFKRTLTQALSMWLAPTPPKPWHWRCGVKIPRLCVMALRLHLPQRWRLPTMSNPGSRIQEAAPLLSRRHHNSELLTFGTIWFLTINFLPGAIQVQVLSTCIPTEFEMRGNTGLVTCIRLGEVFQAAASAFFSARTAFLRLSDV